MYYLNDFIALFDNTQNKILISFLCSFSLLLHILKTVSPQLCARGDTTAIYFHKQASCQGSILFLYVVRVKMMKNRQEQLCGRWRTQKGRFSRGTKDYQRVALF